jgi:peroxiredoxin
MRQLVELQRHESDFAKWDAELIFVFREESEGVEGLKKIKARHKTNFTLALDFEKKSSKAYSTERMTFDNYIIDKSGIVRKSIEGTLKERATSELLLQELKSLHDAQEGPTK